MKTRLMFSVLAVLTLASGAFAQATGYVDGGIVGPLPPPATTNQIPCFKLQDEPEFCLMTVKPRFVKFTLPLDVIDINGEWMDQSGNRLYFYLYNEPSSGGGYALQVEMSLVNRPDGIGTFAGEQRITVYFPDVGEYTGDFQDNGRTIRWNNGTAWFKQ